MTEPTCLIFAPVDESRWDDFTRLFEGRGSPHYCWCMAWRKASADAKKLKGKERKSALKGSMNARVRDGVPIGLLGYDGEDPVAWCSIAPRSTHRTLGGPKDFNDDLNAVWSLTCFFVKRAYRGQNVSTQLVDAAISYARNNGAKIVEAYPVKGDSPSYRFMGVKPLFEDSGFEFVCKAGK